MSTDRGGLTGPGASNPTKSNTGLWSKHRAIAYKVAGEFYPCKPDIFEQTYEPVAEETA